MLSIHSLISINFQELKVALCSEVTAAHLSNLKRALIVVHLAKYCAAKIRTKNIDSQGTDCGDHISKSRIKNAHSHELLVQPKEAIPTLARPGGKEHDRNTKEMTTVRRVRMG